MYHKKKYHLPECGLPAVYAIPPSKLKPSAFIMNSGHIRIHTFKDRILMFPPVNYKRDRINKGEIHSPCDML